MRENYVKHLKLKSIFERENTFHFENSHSVLIGIDEVRVFQMSLQRKISQWNFLFLSISLRDIELPRPNIIQSRDSSYKTKN